MPAYGRWALPAWSPARPAPVPGGCPLLKPGQQSPADTTAAIPGRGRRFPLPRSASVIVTLDPSVILTAASRHTNCMLCVATLDPNARFCRIGSIRSGSHPAPVTAPRGRRCGLGQPHACGRSSRLTRSRVPGPHLLLHVVDGWLRPIRRSSTILVTIGYPE